MLWRAFTLMFEHDRASTRGEMTLRGLYVFTHADTFGSAPAQSLFDRVTVTPAGQQPPRGYADYQVSLPGGSDLPDRGNPRPASADDHCHCSPGRAPARPEPGPAVSAGALRLLPAAGRPDPPRRRVRGRRRDDPRHPASPARPRARRRDPAGHPDPAGTAGLARRPRPDRRLRCRRDPRRTARIIPVEHKSGGYQPGGPADVQLAAQAMCLEEMFGTSVAEGAIFSGCRPPQAPGRGRRGARANASRPVPRRSARSRSQEQLPPALSDSRCRRCSMNHVCLPKVMAGQRAFARAAADCFTTAPDQTVSGHDRAPEHPLRPDTGSGALPRPRRGPRDRPRPARPPGASRCAASTRSSPTGTSASAPTCSARCAEDGRDIVWMITVRAGSSPASTGPCKETSCSATPSTSPTPIPARRLAIARCCVAGKIQNSRQMLLRGARDAAPQRQAELRRDRRRTRSHHPGICRTSPESTSSWEQKATRRASTTGDSPRCCAQTEGIPPFDLRTRRPPTDPVNAVLSFLYGLLRTSIHGGAEEVGLDPYVGFLHGLQARQTRRSHWT